jgi:hypothetical protein
MQALEAVAGGSGLAEGQTAVPAIRGLARGRYWVPLACKLEPALKRLKDRVTGGGVQ